MKKYGTWIALGLLFLQAASSIFVDYRHGNYNLKENSRIYKDLPGFKPIPIAEIGRY